MKLYSRIAKVLFLAFFLLGFTTFSALYSQALIVEPYFPKATDNVTITYDASKGSAGLINLGAPVYMHTGVITNNSTNPSDWKYVVAPWGTADPKVVMQSVGNNIHKASFNIQNFYGVPANETIQKLAFVFRNATGNKEGKDENGGDFFYNVYPNSPDLLTRFITPTGTGSVLKIGDKLDIFGVASQSGNLSLSINGVQIKNRTGDSIRTTITATQSGTFIVRLSAIAGAQSSIVEYSYVVSDPVTIANPPQGTIDGINYLNNTSVVLRLFAPGKNEIYAIGDFNNWTPNSASQLRKSVDGNTFWIQINNLTPGQKYGFQYVVDEILRIADPYSELILDPNNDRFIPSSVYPNPHPYPTGKTNGIISLIQPGKPNYPWKNSNFTPPAKKDLVVYELLVRDFVGTRSFKTLKDTLGYLQRLGVNCIELMPVNEFEGNLSWGYNPSFHMALDKFYGTPDDFKAFVDECHSRGIAVIVDAVFNHAFGQSPLSQMYWNSTSNKPAANNPWLNQDATHPFNVGSDFNHESQATKTFFKQCVKYWLEEYKIDGFRFDLSKGFTQRVNTDVGAWSASDASRIAIWKDYNNYIKSVKSNALVVLEHFADGSEETELNNEGMMVWGNNNFSGKNAVAGNSQNNFSGLDYRSRGWNQANVLAYIESHDEERCVVEALTKGASNGNYNTRNLNIALRRMEMAQALFMAIPGAKMIWQFGELGYDFSINYCTNGTVDPNCRLAEKPVRWDYVSVANRYRIYAATASITWLKRNTTLLSDPNPTSNLSSSEQKSIRWLRNGTTSALLLANFGMASSSFSGQLPNGTYYEYFTGSPITITNGSYSLVLPAGESRLLLTETPSRTFQNFITTGVLDFPGQTLETKAFPNPSNGLVNIQFSEKDKTNSPSLSNTENKGYTLTLFDLEGKVVKTLQIESGQQNIEVDISKFNPGMYFARINGANGFGTVSIIKN
jgi:1,4-alpha-glucan branching enzyme